MCKGVLHESNRAGPEKCCVLLQQVFEDACYTFGLGLQLISLFGEILFPALCVSGYCSSFDPCRAAAHSKLGNYIEATCDCERAIGIDPTYSKAYGRMG